MMADGSIESGIAHVSFHLIRLTRDRLCRSPLTCLAGQKSAINFVDQQVNIRIPAPGAVFCSSCKFDLASYREILQTPARWFTLMPTKTNCVAHSDRQVAAPDGSSEFTWLWNRLRFDICHRDSNG